MSFTPELTMVPRFGLEVSPALVSFAELLMVPFAQMQSVIEQELGSNPALERAEAGECPICLGEWRTRCPVCAAAGPMARAGGGIGDPGRGPAEPTAIESDTDALLRAVVMETDAADRPIVEHLVGSLDRHGLLDRSTAELAAELGVEEAVVARLLAVVRRVGPPGVGATGVAECLLLQLDALGLEDPTATLARAVISDHLPALGKGRFAAIAAALGTTPAQIHEVRDLIRRRLRPYPAFDGNASPMATYVVPDVVVRPSDDVAGEYVVDLVEPALTRLGVRRSAARSPDGRAAASVPQAQAFISRLGDRWETLRRVAECAVDHQREFLVGGPAGLHPLTRADVAAELGLHESTVSRTVADKYVLLPDRSIVPLADFFGSSGGLDGELRQLLDSTQGRVSDQRLAELLSAGGHPVARRTVAKHRARLGYPANALR